MPPNTTALQPKMAALLPIKGSRFKERGGPGQSGRSLQQQRTASHAPSAPARRTCGHARAITSTHSRKKVKKRKGGKRTCPEEERGAEEAGAALAALAVDGDDVGAAAVEPRDRALAEGDQRVQRGRVVVPHRQLLHLSSQTERVTLCVSVPARVHAHARAAAAHAHTRACAYPTHVTTHSHTDLAVEQANVIVAVAGLLVGLGEVQDEEGAVVAGGEEARDLLDVVAVGGVVDARQRHPDQPVRYVRQ
eukprot:3939069-Rhodomonas_salina.1